MIRAAFLSLVMLLSLANTADREINALVEEERFTEAMAIARTASEIGDAKAHEWLGWFYENGNGVEVDHAKAALHYRKAVDADHDFARWRLGVLIDEGKAKGDPKEAIALFRICAAHDYVHCLVSLGVMQATGRGTMQDYTAAFQNYLRAATLGDPGGMRGVGVMVLLGEGVEKDPQEAASWFLLSAVLGNEPARTNLEQVLNALPDIDQRKVALRAREIGRDFGLQTDNVLIVDNPEDGPSSTN